MRKESAPVRPHRVVPVASPVVPLFEFAIAGETCGTDRRHLTSDTSTDGVPPAQYRQPFNQRSASSCLTDLVR